MDGEITWGLKATGLYGTLWWSYTSLDVKYITAWWQHASKWNTISFWLSSTMAHFIKHCKTSMTNLDMVFLGNRYIRYECTIRKLDIYDRCKKKAHCKEKFKSECVSSFSLTNIFFLCSFFPLQISFLKPAMAHTASKGAVALPSPISNLQH